MPDVPPPPPGRWPLVEARPSPPWHGSSPGPLGSIAPPAGVGLSTAAVALYLAGQLGLQLVAALVLVGAGLIDATSLDPETGGAALLALVVASQCAGLLAVLVLLRRRGVLLRPLVGAVRPLGRLIRVGAGLGIVALLGSTVVVGILVALTGSEATPDQVLTGAITETPLQLLLAVIAAVVLAPIAEELLFRGLLHRALRSRMRMVPATLLSSVLFAVIHVDVALSQPLALAGLTLVGVILAVAYERTESLVVPVMIHAVHNALTIVAVVLTSRIDLEVLVSTGRWFG